MVPNFGRLANSTMKLQVTLLLLCFLAMASAYTVLSGCGCHFGGCICVGDDGKPVTLGIPKNGKRSVRSLFGLDQEPWAGNY